MQPGLGNRASVKIEDPEYLTDYDGGIIESLGFISDDPDNLEDVDDFEDTEPQELETESVSLKAPVLTKDQEIKIARLRDDAHANWCDSLYRHPLTAWYLIRDLSLNKKGPGQENVELVDAYSTIEEESITSGSYLENPETIGKLFEAVANTRPKLDTMEKLTRRVLRREDSDQYGPFEAMLAESSELKFRENQIALSEREFNQQANRFMEHNVRLVASIAKNYTGSGMPMEDIIGNGLLGVRAAAVKFDWKRGLKFSTYATWWIRRAISRAILNEAQMIRKPIHVSTTLGKILRETDSFRLKNGRDPTDIELARIIGLDESKIRNLRFHLEPVLSLDIGIGEQEGSKLLDVVQDRTSMFDSPESLNDKRTALKELLANLDKKQRTVLSYRYGLNDGIPRSHEEIGELLEISPESAKRAETAGLKKLRDIVKASGKVKSLFGD